ncbi:MAG: NAD(P)H-binding protein, partial [Gemmatimonadales bacterium]
MILIVGGTGTLGRELVPRLLANGHKVRVMTRDPTRATAMGTAGAEVVVGDLRNPASLRAAVQGVRAVVSAAHSIVGAWRSSSARVDDIGQRALIASAVEEGVDHLVFISVLGASTSHPLDFWQTKARMEETVKASGLGYTIVRPTAFLDFHAYELVGKAIEAGRRVMVFGPGTSPKNFVAAA